MALYDLTLPRLDGQPQSLSEYEGKVLLLVNVASKCGLTPQYEGLEGLYERYRDRGLEVLGFPCNQFAGQEPGTAEQIQEFCSLTYGVRFPMFGKLDVNGPDRSPLYAWLTSQQTQPEGPGDIAWNFAKFVVDRQGRVVARFSPRTTPDDPELVAAIERAL